MAHFQLGWKGEEHWDDVPLVPHMTNLRLSSAVKVEHPFAILDSSSLACC